MANFDEWPERQRKMMGEVAAGLVDGDLEPLAAYFRAGFTEIEPALAAEIADMIDSREGYTPYRLAAVGRRRGELGFTANAELHQRKMEIGVFMEDRVRRAGKGGYDAALAETLAHFGLKSGSTVHKAHRYVRDYMARTIKRPDWDQWAFLQDFYLAPND